MKGTVYLLTFKNSQHWAVGSTIRTLPSRKGVYVRDAVTNRLRTKLYDEIRGCGADGFELTQLHEHEVETLEDLRIEEDKEMRRRKDNMCLNSRAAHSTKEQDDEVQRKWRERTRDERLAYSKQYRETHREERAEYERAHRQPHQTTIKPTEPERKAAKQARAKAWLDANRAEVNEKSRVRMAALHAKRKEEGFVVSPSTKARRLAKTNEWRANNRDHVNELAREQYHNRTERTEEQKERARARKRKYKEKKKLERLEGHPARTPEQSVKKVWCCLTNERT